jgi:CO/xanthine dehydrogenase FAD-binding subunit
MYDLNIVRPETLHEALELKKEHGENLHPLAGGTDILVSIRNKSVNWGPKPSLLSLNRIRELHFVKETNYAVEIGPLLTHTEIVENKVIKNHVPTLCKAISFIGSPQIRNRGTIAGNVVHASPAADCLPILYARDSKVEVRTNIQSKLVPIQDFISGPGIVRIDPHGVVTKIVVPKLPRYVGDYLSLRQRRAQSCNVVSVGVEMKIDVGKVKDIRIALGAVAPTVVRGDKTELLLRNRKLSPDIIEEAQTLIETECQPIDDVRSNSKYRRAMTGVLLARFLRNNL